MLSPLGTALARQADHTVSKPSRLSAAPPRLPNMVHQGVEAQISSRFSVAGSPSCDPAHRATWRGAYQARFRRVRGTAELRIPPLGNPELFLIYQFRDIAIMTAGQMPDEPSDAVSIRFRLVMEVFFVQTVEHRFDVVGDT